MSNPLSPNQQPNTTAPRKNRTIVYIDGFNFYYGLLADRPDLKWLNYQRLAELLRPEDDLLKVKLFTTVVDQPPRMTSGVSTKHDRQARYLAALRAQPKMEIILGKFSSRERECGVRDCSIPGGPRRRYWAREEKQTDVQLALQIVLDLRAEKDAGRHLDNIVLMSADIDIVPALAAAWRLDKTVKTPVYLPVHEAKLTYRRKDDFSKYSDPVRPIPEKYLRQAQFPDVVPLPSGQTLQRPSEWPAGKTPPASPIGTMSQRP